MTMNDIDNNIMRFTSDTKYIELVETFPANYQVRIGNNAVDDIRLRLGGVYTIIIRQTTPGNYVRISRKNKTFDIIIFSAFCIFCKWKSIFKTFSRKFHNQYTKSFHFCFCC
jgi:hypothetical protein